MATEKKISELDPATSLSETDVVPGNQGSSTKKISITVLRTVLNAISQTFNGIITADAFVGDGSGLTGITGGTGGIENTGSTTIKADTDVNGVGVVALQTRNITRLTAENNGDITANTGSIAIAAIGKGVDFSAAGGEIFDYYKRGTFTATLGGTTTDPTATVTSTGYYTKIGDMVFTDVSFANRDIAGAAGQVEVRGYPFLSGSNRAYGSVRFTSIFPVSEAIVAAIQGGTSQVVFTEQGTNVPPTLSAGPARYLRFSINYRTT